MQYLSHYLVWKSSSLYADWGYNLRVLKVAHTDKELKVWIMLVCFFIYDETFV